MQHKTWIEISRSALGHNLATARAVLTQAQVMCVVKANAYGHGALLVARILEAAGVQWFGVDSVDEALALRTQGIKSQILILGYTPRERLRDVVRNRCIQTAYHIDTLRELALVASQRYPARIHLKIETGLHRQGIECQDIPAFLRQLKRAPQVRLEGASTHFANIEDTRDPAYAHRQLRHFEQALDLMRRAGVDPAWKHAACSAAAFVYPETHFNLIRLGISLYGYWSSELTEQMCRSRQLALKPALAWKTCVAQVKRVAKGEAVGYGLTRRLTRASRIAVLPVGYADGFDRSAQSNRGQVLIRGQRCPIVGRVCMNMCMADVTDVPRVGLEDEVVLIGTQGRETISAEALGVGQTNVYETLSRLNPLIPRVLAA